MSPIKSRAYAARYAGGATPIFYLPVGDSVVKNDVSELMSWAFRLRGWKFGFVIDLMVTSRLRGRIVQVGSSTSIIPNGKLTASKKSMIDS